jgi:hypothetical protein
MPTPFSGPLRLSPAPVEAVAERFQFYLTHPDELCWHHAVPKSPRTRVRNDVFREVVEPAEETPAEENAAVSGDLNEPVIIDNDKERTRPPKLKGVHGSIQDRRNQNWTELQS